MELGAPRHLRVAPVTMEMLGPTDVGFGALGEGVGLIGGRWLAELPIVGEAPALYTMAEVRVIALSWSLVDDPPPIAYMWIAFPAAAVADHAGMLSAAMTCYGLAGDGEAEHSVVVAVVDGEFKEYLVTSCPRESAVAYFDGAAGEAWPNAAEVAENFPLPAELADGPGMQAVMGYSGAEIRLMANGVAADTTYHSAEETIAGGAFRDAAAALLEGVPEAHPPAAWDALLPLAEDLPPAEPPARGRRPGTACGRAGSADLPGRDAAAAAGEAATRGSLLLGPGAAPARGRGRGRQAADPGGAASAPAAGRGRAAASSVDPALLAAITSIGDQLRGIEGRLVQLELPPASAAPLAGMPSVLPPRGGGPQVYRESLPVGPPPQRVAPEPPIFGACRGSGRGFGQRVLLGAGGARTPTMLLQSDAEAEVRERPPTPTNAGEAVQLHMMSLLSEQTKLLVGLRRPQDPLGALGAGDSEGSAAGSYGGARGAAALEMLREDLEKRPLVYSTAVRRRIALALGTQPDQPQDAEEYLRRFGAFGRHRDLGYVAMLAGGIWNKMEMADWEAAHAQMAMLMVALDQVTHDDRWDLAFLLTHRPEPPRESQSRYQQSDGLRPYSCLAEPRWIAAGMAYIKDIDGVQTAMRKQKDGKAKGKGKEGKDKPAEA